MPKLIHFGGKKDLKFKKELANKVEQLENVLGLPDQEPLTVLTTNDTVNLLDYLYEIQRTVTALIALLEGS